MKFIDKNNSKSLVSHLLKIREDIKINELLDQDGFSLLHMAVFKNKGKSFDAIMKFALDELDSREVAEWINLQTTKDQFTALHYASYRGNIHFCDILMKNGANKQIKNAYGLNVLHIAA
jgi:ankyrin repeat protein